MENWREYIKENFGESGAFDIENMDGEFVKISSVRCKCTTRIEFIFIDEKELEDIHFWGSDELKCGIWMSHFTTEKKFAPDVSAMEEFSAMIEEKYYPSVLPFKKEIIKRLEEKWLYIPLRTGWYEKSIIVGEKLYYSELSVNSGYKSGEPLTYSPLESLNLFDRIKKVLGYDVKVENYHFEPIIKGNYA